VADYVAMRLDHTGSQGSVLILLKINAPTKQIAMKVAKSEFEVIPLQNAGANNNYTIFVKLLEKFVRDSWESIQIGMTKYNTKGINPYTGETLSKAKRMMTSDPYHWVTMPWNKLSISAKISARRFILEELSDKEGKIIKL
jgi:hypothetical protein